MGEAVSQNFLIGITLKVNKIIVGLSFRGIFSFSLNLINFFDCTCSK